MRQIPLESGLRRGIWTKVQFYSLTASCKLKKIKQRCYQFSLTPQQYGFCSILLNRVISSCFPQFSLTPQQYGFCSILLNRVISSCFPQFSLTPLHLASWYGHESVVKLLLKYGANVNTKDRVSNKRWGKGSSCLLLLLSLLFTRESLEDDQLN